MFIHIFKNRIKILLREKTLIFWNLIFPIILGSLFFLAFSNLNESVKFEAIPIAIINNENYQNDANFKAVMESLGNGEEKLFNINYVLKSEAEKMLKDSEIKGYIEISDEITLTVINDSYEETFIKYVLDNYKETISMVENLYEFNPLVLSESLMNDISSEFNFIKEDNSNATDITVIYFYSLIGMICLYGGFYGIKTVNEIEANLTPNGARISMAPVSKFKLLFPSIMASICIQTIVVLINLVYLINILNIEFGTKLFHVGLISMIGIIAGISLGTFIGAISKKDEEKKSGILIAITMTFSFLSGMMGSTSVKYFIDTKLPILSKINPVNMITDGLYSLYYHNSYTRYLNNLFCLGVFSLVLIIFTLLLLRRKKYDSI